MHKNCCFSTNDYSIEIRIINTEIGDDGVTFRMNVSVQKRKKSNNNIRDWIVGELSGIDLYLYHTTHSTSL